MPLPTTFENPANILVNFTETGNERVADLKGLFV
jgi:hypothetical protein